MTNIHTEHEIFRTDLVRNLHGYRSVEGDAIQQNIDSMTEEYADAQGHVNPERVRSFVRPIIEQGRKSIVLDIGCGIGAMVEELLSLGYNAYGADLVYSGHHWANRDLDRDRYFFVDDKRLNLPFIENVVDFAFTFGVIEHVGTTDGHANRRPDYHEVRKQWLREIYRVIRPGGRLLIGGPNRGFPVDTAHGLDSRAKAWEKKISEMAGITIHSPWSENFLWGYGDLRRYLEGVPYRLEPLSVSEFLHFSRVPSLLRGIARFYVKHLPSWLLATGFNPWVLAIVHKPE